MPASTSRVLVVNAQFFSTDKDPAVLSYAIKDNGYIYYSGDPNSATNGKQLNVYPNNTVTVTNSNAGNYNEQNAATAIVGKNINNMPSPNFSLGRTYLCALNTNRGNNVMLIYVTHAKTQYDANAELASWGCYENNTVGMDGSGSSQMYTKKSGAVVYGISNPSNGTADRRTIPQAIGIYNDAN